MRCAVLGLLCPLLSGCIGFGYPAISSTPPIPLDRQDVRAFREAWSMERGGALIAGSITVSHQVQEVPVTEATVGAQRDVHFAYYYLLFPFTGSNARSTTVLLYRPGHETVEIEARSWWRSLGQGKPVAVVWKEAPDLAAQEKALERIVGERGGSCLGKEVEQFAAREYARLANSLGAAGPEMQATRERCLARARELEQRGRDRADKPG